MPINVNLTPHLENLIKKKVASGLYNSASEVVREALRLLEDQDRMRSAKLEQLRQDIQDGLNSGEPVPWNAREVKRKGRLKRTARSKES